MANAGTYKVQIWLKTAQMPIALAEFDMLIVTGCRQVHPPTCRDFDERHDPEEV